MVRASGWYEIAVATVPYPPWLRGYRRSWLAADLVAGLTLAAIAVPEQIATARLGNFPASAGLYAFIAGSLAIAMLGAHQHMSVGGDSTITPVFAAGVAAVAASGGTRYAHLVTFVAIVVGIVVAAAGLLRFGWIADFLPSPVVTGVLAGIAIEIAARQLPAVLGTTSGGTTTVGRLEALFDHRSQVNGWAVGIAVIVLVIIVAVEHINRRVPGALAALVLSTASVAILALRSHGVRVLGSFHSGVPSFGVPAIHLSDVRRLTTTVLTVSFLCVVQTAATARSSASSGSPTDPDPAQGLNRDLVAIGAGSILAGLSGSFAVNASPPRSAVVETAGGRTQVSSLVAAGAVVAVLAAAGLLKDLPQATLGAILLYIASRLFKVGELRRVLAFDRIEFAIAAMTVIVVGFVGIEQGVAAAILLALALRTRLAARPRAEVLGREPHTDHWIPQDIGRPTEEVPGVFVYLLYAPLWYGNASFVTARLRAAVATGHPPIRAVVIDADGIADIDYTGARQLSDLAVEFRQKGVRLAIARASHLVHHDLKRSGLLKSVGQDFVFTTVEDAVRTLTGGASAKDS